MTATAQVEQPTELLEVLGRTEDAMIAVDAQLRVVSCNEAATELLGYTASEALGRFCYELLGWRDRCGDQVCAPECAASEPGPDDQIIPTREVLGRSAMGKTLWLNVTTIVPPPELRADCRLVHLMREVALPPELERLVVERLDGWSVADPEAANLLETLTPREREVLRLLTEGFDANGIADRLYVSRATVRNHIQHILGKLGVHSRVEAVAMALRHGR